MLTRKELIALLKKAGWTKTANSATSIFVSPNGTYFQLDKFTADIGIYWQHYAALEQIPAEIPDEGQLYREI